MCLSVVSDAHLGACERVVAAVKSGFPEVVVIVGGRAFGSQEQAAAMGADGFSLEAVRAADLLVELVS